MESDPNFRPCCSDAFTHKGDAAPILGDVIGRLIPADLDLPVVPAEKVRRPANTARHESAHGLVTLALGGAVGRITVEGQALAQCTLPDGAPWSHRVAVDLAGDAATVGDLDDHELAWHVSAVRQCGGGLCDRCNATRQIVVGLRHPSDEEVVAEYRRIEAVLIEFFERHDVRALVSDIAWWLGDDQTIYGDEIMNRFGPQVRALKLEI